jgi:WD40 repeat protein
VTGLAFSPDGTQLTQVSYDGTVKQWDLTTGNCLQTFTGHTDRVLRVAWSTDGRLLASGGRDFIVLWGAFTRVRLHELRAPDAVDPAFQGIAWSPDGSLLAVGSYLHGVQVWEMATRIRRWIAQTQATRIRRVAWSPDGSLLVGGGYDGSVYVWDASDGLQQQRLVGHGVLMVACSPLVVEVERVGNFLCGRCRVASGCAYSQGILT